MTRWAYQMGAAAVSLVLAVPAGAVTGQQYLDQSQSAPRAVPPTERPMTFQTPTPSPHSESRPTPESVGLRGFSVSLVLGEMQGSSTPDNLPSGAKKAIADMRDFLHYKSYRMLDVQWALCCSGRVPTGISGRLRGLEEDDHWFQVVIREIQGNRMSVAFQLRDAEGHADDAHKVVTAVTQAEGQRRMAELIRQREQLETEMAQAEQKYGSRHPQVASLRARLDTVKRQFEETERSLVQGARTTASTRRTAGRMLLDNTFSMDVGETVVIGTSRVKGDKALIALLTAASRAGK
jgi:hypothetical protein